MADTFFAGIPLDGSGVRPLDADLYGAEQQGVDADNISATGNLNIGNVIRYDEHSQRYWNGGAARDNAGQNVPDETSAPHTSSLSTTQNSYMVGDQGGADSGRTTSAPPASIAASNTISNSAPQTANSVTVANGGSGTDGNPGAPGTPGANTQATTTQTTSEHSSSTGDGGTTYNTTTYNNTANNAYTTNIQQNYTQNTYNETSYTGHDPDGGQHGDHATIINTIIDNTSIVSSVINETINTYNGGPSHGDGHHCGQGGDFSLINIDVNNVLGASLLNQVIDINGGNNEGGGLLQNAGGLPSLVESIANLAVSAVEKSENVLAGTLQSTLLQASALAHEAASLTDNVVGHGVSLAENLAGDLTSSLNATTDGALNLVDGTRITAPIVNDLTAGLSVGPCSLDPQVDISFLNQNTISPVAEVIVPVVTTIANGGDLNMAASSLIGDVAQINNALSANSLDPALYMAVSAGNNIAATVAETLTAPAVIVSNVSNIAQGGATGTVAAILSPVVQDVGNLSATAGETTSGLQTHTGDVLSGSVTMVAGVIDGVLNNLGSSVTTGGIGNEVNDIGATLNPEGNLGNLANQANATIVDPVGSGLMTAIDGSANSLGNQIGETNIGNIAASAENTVASTIMSPVAMAAQTVSAETGASVANPAVITTSVLKTAGDTAHLAGQILAPVADTIVDNGVSTASEVSAPVIVTAEGAIGTAIALSPIHNVDISTPAVTPVPIVSATGDTILSAAATANPAAVTAAHDPISTLASLTANAASAAVDGGALFAAAHATVSPLSAAVMPVHDVHLDHGSAHGLL